MVWEEYNSVRFDLRWFVLNPWIGRNVTPFNLFLDGLCLIYGFGEMLLQTILSRECDYEIL